MGAGLAVVGAGLRGGRASWEVEGRGFGPAMGAGSKIKGKGTLVWEEGGEKHESE